MIDDPGRDVGFVSEHGSELQPFEGLEYRRNGAVRHVERLDYLAYRAVGVEVFLLGFLHHDIPLRYGSDEEALLFGFADQPYRFLAAYGYGKYGSGKQHRIAQRQYGEYVRQFGFVDFHYVVSLDDGDDADLCSGREGEFFILSHVCQNVSIYIVLNEPAILVNLCANAKSFCLAAAR